MVLPFNPLPDDSRPLWPQFDLASLEHLYLIAQIPSFRDSVNEYVRTHFRGRNVYLAENVRPIDECSTYFRSQQIYVRSMDTDTLNYVAENFPNLLKITFESRLCQNIPIERADILSNQMKMVFTVVFNVDQFCEPIYNRLLHLARDNIKILIINSTSIIANHIDYHFVPQESTWYSQLYPKLSTVQWDDGIISNPHEFRNLVANNSNIQQLIFTRHICAVMDFIESYNLQLHRLDVKMSSEDLPHIDAICRRLNRLFDNGQFKQLYVTFDHYQRTFNRHLCNLKGLKGITYNGKYIPAIGEITQLIELRVDSMDVGLDAAIQLIALRDLYINSASIDAIGPFICEAPQINKLVIKNAEVNSSDVMKFRLLAAQRDRLPNAQPLRIYLEEQAYCMLKSFETRFSKPLVNVRRIEELLN